MEKFKALATKINFEFLKIRKDLKDMRDGYRDDNASYYYMKDDKSKCERHEVNHIQLEGYQNQNSHDSYSHQSHYDPNDSRKSLTELKNDVIEDLDDFKSYVYSKRTDHDNLFDENFCKPTGVLPNQKPNRHYPQSRP